LIFGPYFAHLIERNLVEVPLMVVREGNTDTLIVRTDPGMPHIVVFDDELNEPTFIPRIRRSDYDRLRSEGWEKILGFGEIDCSASMNSIAMTYFDIQSRKRAGIVFIAVRRRCFMSGLNTLSFMGKPNSFVATFSSLLKSLSLLR